MTLQTQSAAFISPNVTWLDDDAAGDTVPCIGNTPIDLYRGYGRMYSTPVGGGTAVLARSLVNQFLPAGLAMVQTVPGAETNTFTTRVLVSGTLVNTFNFNGTQVAGTFPAGSLNLLGRTIRIKATGTMGNTSTPNFTFDYALGTSGANVLATTGSLASQAVTTPGQWYSEVQATVTTAGASGVIQSGGHFSFQGTTGVLVTPWTMGNSTKGTGLSVDLTTALAFGMYATCGASSASNRVIVSTLTVEILY
jgi:hypothetical protein